LEWKAWARSVFPTREDGDAEETFASTWSQHADGVRQVFERVREDL
jgi:hypothetical protein